MNFKHRIITLTLISLLAVLVAGCGGKTAPAANLPEENLASDPAEMPVEEGNVNQPEIEPGPEPTEEPAPAEEQPTVASEVSFAADVLPILDSRCLNCHGGERVEGDFVLSTYAELMDGGESGPAVIPGDADSSYLAELILAQEMPKRGPKLTPVQTQTIIDWINQGAPNN
ncbi:MAG: hypothetical protein JW757_11695 [Anaerolineales bacterium]|nr:hypothetical protein [Anaerolineales bacterium]